MLSEKYNEVLSMAPRVPQSQTAVDKCPAAVIQYVPELGDSGSTAALKLLVGTTITITVDDAAPAGNDAIGADGVIDLTSSTYDTMGELCDYVNGRRAYRMYLVAAKRADAVANLITTTSTSIMGDNGLTLYFDTSVAASPIGIAISGEKFINNGKNGHLKDWDSQCVNILDYCDITAGVGTGTLTLKVYSGKVGETEVEMYSYTLTEDTQKQLGEADASASYIIGPPGHRLIVRAETTTAFDAVNVHVIGRSAPLKGDRMVSEDNY